MLRKDLPVGYLYVDKHTRQTIPSPQQAIEAVEKLADSVIGQQHSVSVADDMDLYSVERKMPS